jgi:ABC-type cobalamin transport system permease subunit
MQQFLKFIFLTFIYSSTCFGRPYTHHKELNNCSINLWFYRWSLVIAVLLVVVGPAATAVIEFLMMGVRTPETC